MHVFSFVCPSVICGRWASFYYFLLFLFVSVSCVSFLTFFLFFIISHSHTPSDGRRRMPCVPCECEYSIRIFIRCDISICIKKEKCSLDNFCRSLRLSNVVAGGQANGRACVCVHLCECAMRHSNSMAPDVALCYVVALCDGLDSFEYCTYARHVCGNNDNGMTNVKNVERLVKSEGN